MLCVGRIEATATNLSSLSKVFEPLLKYVQCRRVESANSWEQMEMVNVWSVVTNKVTCVFSKTTKCEHIDAFADRCSYRHVGI